MVKSRSTEKTVAIYRPIPDLATQAELFKAAAKQFNEKHNKSPKKARKLLQEEGILDQEGNLTPEYGG